MCIDNSDWTRSGDYAPTRFQAQTDAVNLLAGAKTQANPENTVGVLTMAGKSPRVLVTPTPDLGKVLNCMTDIAIEGDSNVATAVQIAQLALKHRQNKNQRQRIVIFAGSPLLEDKVWKPVAPGCLPLKALQHHMLRPLAASGQHSACATVSRLQSHSATAETCMHCCLLDAHELLPPLHPQTLQPPPTTTLTHPHRIHL